MFPEASISRKMEQINFLFLTPNTIEYYVENEHKKTEK